MAFLNLLKSQTRSQTNFKFHPVQLNIKIVARFDTGAQHQPYGMTDMLGDPYEPLLHVVLYSDRRATGSSLRSRVLNYITIS